MVATVYISIGNSDDKLTQAEWAQFCIDMAAEVISLASVTRGAWFSNPVGPWQNACWCVDFSGSDVVAEAKEICAQLARKYRQDSIAWALVARTEFVS